MATKNKTLKEVLESIDGPITFGRYVRGTRTRLDLSQVELAKMIGISKSSLCDIEKDRQYVSIALACKIAKKCGVPETVAIQLSVGDQLRRLGYEFTLFVKAS